MSSLTTNLKLIKPSETDIVNINDINSNMDKIDSEIKKISNELTERQFYTLKTENILNWANSLPNGIYDFGLAGTEYTGGNLPSGTNWLYSSGTVYKRNVSSIFIVLVNEKNEIATRTYSGSAWLDWDFVIMKSQIQRGRTEIERKINAIYEKTITFPKAFTKTPAVTVSMETSGVGTNFITASNVSEKGFTVYSYSTDSQTPAALSWIAIEP